MVRPAAGYLSLSEAADELGVTEWDVTSLVEQDALRAVTLIDAASLARYQEAS